MDLGILGREKEHDKKYKVKYNRLFSWVSESCLMVEANVITLSYMVLNVYWGSS